MDWLIIYHDFIFWICCQSNPIKIPLPCRLLSDVMSGGGSQPDLLTPTRAWLSMVRPLHDSVGEPDAATSFDGPDAN